MIEITLQEVEAAIGYKIHSFDVSPVMEGDEIVGYSVRVVPAQEPKTLAVTLK